MAAKRHGRFCPTCRKGFVASTSERAAQVLAEHMEREHPPAKVVEEFQVVRSASGLTSWTPWTDGFAVGFRVHNEESGRTRYIYLNPSTEGDVDPGGDRGTTFLYYDDHGDPADGATVTYIDALWEE